MDSNLPKLDLKEDMDKYEAHQEKKEVIFGKCAHKKVVYENDSLKCTCGAGWSGERLGELLTLLTS